MAQPKIPKYGSWEDGGSHGYTVQFEKVREVKHQGSILTRNGLSLNQDVLLSPPTPKDQEQEGGETRKVVDEGLPTKANNKGNWPNNKMSVKKKSSLHVTSPVPEFGVWDKSDNSDNFTDIFKENQRDQAGAQSRVDVNLDHRRHRLTKKSKKCGCYKWLFG